MNFTRESGVLLHPTSLPAIRNGELGPSAYTLRKRYKKWASIYAGVALGPTGYGDSPYQSFSHCRNTLLISFDLLMEDGLLSRKRMSDSFRSQMRPWTSGR